MGEILRPEDLSTYIRDLERRVTTLERAQRVGSVAAPAYPAETPVFFYEDFWYPVWELPISLNVHDAIRYRVTTITVGDGPPPTVAALRLTTNTTGGPYYSYEAVVGTTQTQTTFNWRIPGTVPTGNLLIQLQAKIVSGTGYLKVYPPFARLALADLINATETGE
jgi:hypothetical protein